MHLNVIRTFQQLQNYILFILVFKYLTLLARDDRFVVSLDLSITLWMMLCSLHVLYSEKFSKQREAFALKLNAGVLQE